jgi:hypothetical protein
MSCDDEWTIQQFFKAMMACEQGAIIRLARSLIVLSPPDVSQTRLATALYGS